MSASNKVSLFIAGSFFLVIIGFLGYYPQQNDFTLLFPGFLAAFGGYYFFCTKLASQNNFYFWLAVAVLARFILLFSTPNLSDDIFRFIWDGRLLNHGINPFEQLPSYYMIAGNEVDGITKSIFDELNSQEYFTVYPPVCQAIFAFSTWLFPKSILGTIITMKAFFLFFEIGTLIFLYKLLSHFKLDKKLILWYALNPLIILELTGNLHFEALMVFFLIAAIYYYEKSNLTISGIAMGLAIATKLLPLMFLPFFIRRLGWKKAMIYFTIIGVSLVALFAPLFSSVFLSNIGSSIGLYFQRFEFNGSIYYFFRWLGLVISGHNIIEGLGPILALIVFFTIISRTHKETDLSTLHLIRQMLFSLTLFLFLTTTVMPWYLSGLILFSVFTGHRYPMVWSFMILMTYINYSYPEFEENFMVVRIEYLVVWAVVWKERALFLSKN